MLIKPPIATISDPSAPGDVLPRDGLGIVEAYDDHGALDGFEMCGIGGRSGEEGLARIGPDVTIVRGEGADGKCGGRASGDNDLVELAVNGMSKGGKG